MVSRLLLNGAASLIAIVMIAFAVLHPWQVSAVGGAADLVCFGCQNTDPSKPGYCKSIPCSDSTFGFGTTGRCSSSGVCLGTGTSGPNGFGIGQVAEILGPLMSALMQSSQGAGSSPVLPTPCQATAPTGVAAQLLASTTASSTTPTPTNIPCGSGTTNPITTSSLLTGSTLVPNFSTSGTSLTNALNGTNCGDAATCGISDLANQLTSSVAGEGADTGTNLVPNNAIVPSASSSDATTTDATTTVSGQVGIFDTGSTIAPQGLTIGKDASAIIFNYAPLGQNAQIAGFIPCDANAANAVPYVPLSAIQNACR